VGHGTFGNKVFENILELFCERWIFDIKRFSEPVERVMVGHRVPPVDDTRREIHSLVLM
jgi:hypothetical protein